MGTRSTTFVQDEDGEDIVCMYRQFDGYPSGHGKELADFLQHMVMINGISGQKAGEAANGMGCLAAQIVEHFKDHGIGGIYLYPPKKENAQSYNYIVKMKGGKLNIILEEFGKVVFDGPPSQFIDEFLTKDDVESED